MRVRPRRRRCSWVRARCSRRSWRGRRRRRSSGCRRCRARSARSMRPGRRGSGSRAQARAAGIEVMVCSPGAIPRQPGDRIKTDTRDALKLARLHAAGQLRPVVVPAPELEALRDLVRAREDLRGDLMGARHRISKLLLRRGHVFDGPGETWSQRHLTWLAQVRFEQPLVRRRLRRVPRPPRGAARAPRSPRRADRRAGRCRGRGRRRSPGCAACAASTR